jgi:hypothetical protein
MQRIQILAAVALMQGLVATIAHAHSGALDANGCHYETASGAYHCHKEVKPNANVHAAVKKSRENVCHDKSSPNYSTLKYFIAYKTLADCLASGGRAPG